MKVFPTTVRRTVVVGGGEVDGTIATGTDGASLSGVLGTLAAQSTGSGGASLGISARSATLPTGTGGASLAFTETGSGARSTGTDGASLAAQGTGTETQSTGSSGASLAINASGTATGWTATATNVRNSGSIDWTSPTNAQGDFTGTEASITAAASPTAAAAYDADLKCTGFALGTTPSGWTRSAVHLLIRHRWDLTVGALSTASIVVTVRDSANAVLATPINRAQGSGDQGSLLTETFDVTSAVSGLTDVQLQDVRVWCEADCNLLIATGGNASWQVDGVHIRVTYTRTGLN